MDWKSHVIRTIAPLLSLLLATAILLVGNGMLGTLIPIRAGIDGFSTATIGMIGSIYFAGFLLGCLMTPYVVRRVGHIRSFAILCAIASTAPLIHGLSDHPAIWAIMRGITGICFAGLYMVIESWLNETATNETRGRIFSIYLMINMSAMMLGQVFLNLADPAAFALFALCSILTSLALVPVALTTSVQPQPLQSTRINLPRLYRLSPVGLLGSMVVGLANAPFWTLAPLFAKSKGLDVAGISLFMTMAIIGGAVAQWPIGRLSDRMDRRRIICLVSIGAGLAELGFVFAGSLGQPQLLLAIAFGYGVFAFTLYSVVVAHMNDHAASESFVSVSGGLLIAYAAGAIVGPFLASLGADHYGLGFIFVFGAATHALFIVFVIYRMMTNPPPAADQRSNFVAVPQPSASVPSELDPRADQTGDDVKK